MKNTIEEFIEITKEILQDLAKTLPEIEPPKITYIKGAKMESKVIYEAPAKIVKKTGVSQKTGKEFKFYTLQIKTDFGVLEYNSAHGKDIRTAKFDVLMDFITDIIDEGG